MQRRACAGVTRLLRQLSLGGGALWLTTSPALVLSCGCVRRCAGGDLLVGVPLAGCVLLAMLGGMAAQRAVYAVWAHLPAGLRARRPPKE